MSKKMHPGKLSVIVPAFNEERNIQRFEKELIGELKKLCRDYEIIAVDDGSADGTFEELMKLKKKCPNLKIIKNGKNSGMGYSIRRGINLASGDLTLTLDSDLTFHPREIKKLLDRFEVGDVDCVIGSYIKKGKAEDVKFFRLLMSRGVNLIYSMLLGARISCISPIFKLYKTDQIKNLRLESKGFIINAEIVTKLLRSKKKFTEVPVTLTKRIYGESKINVYKEIKNHILFMMKTLKWRTIG